MSESRVRENCMHGLTGGRWRSDTDLAEMGEKAEAQHPTSGDGRPASGLPHRQQEPYFRAKCASSSSGAKDIEEDAMT